MIPLLPTELLRLILDNFRLPGFSSYRRTQVLEKETRSTLYALTLASRTFYQIAHPLLYQFIRIQNDQQFFHLLANNSRNSLLDLVSILVIEQGLDLESLGIDAAALRSFFHRVNQLVGSCRSALRYLSGSSLTRLFLKEVKLDLDKKYKLILPSLELLGLYDASIRSGSRAARCFPSLRHVVFDHPGAKTTADDRALFDVLAAQLPSVTIYAVIYADVTSKHTSLEIDSILVIVPLIWCDDTFDFRTPRVVNLRFEVMSTLRSSPGVFDEAIADILHSFAARDQWIHLRTIYLPFLDSLTGEPRSDTIADFVKDLALTCRRRNIEVILEDQSDQHKAESHVSEEFMRRMTKQRMERDAVEISEKA